MVEAFSQVVNIKMSDIERNLSMKTMIGTASLRKNVWVVQGSEPAGPERNLPFSNL